MDVALHFMRSNNNVTANHISTPDYDVVWAGIDCASGAGSGDCDVSSDSGEDDEGDNGIDPINFWQ